MKKNGIFWMFAMLMIAIGMSSCSKDDESPEITNIVGKWESNFVDNDGYRVKVDYTFKEDGTYTCYSTVKGVGSAFCSTEVYGYCSFVNNKLTFTEKKCKSYAKNENGKVYCDNESTSGGNAFSFSNLAEIIDSKLYIYELETPLILQDGTDFIISEKTEFSYLHQ